MSTSSGSGFDDLQAAVAQLQADVSANDAEMGAIAQALATSQQQIIQLQQQVAAGNAVSQADLEALATTVSSIATAASAATAAAVSETGVDASAGTPPVQ